MPPFRILDRQYGIKPAVPPDVPNRLLNIGGPSGVADQSPLQRVVFPPRVEKLLSSQDFNAQDWNVTLAAGAGAQAVSTNLIFTLPRGMVGWLQNLSIYVLSMTNGTLVTFQLRINQSPVSGFDNLQNSPGVANLFRVDNNDMRIRIPDGAIVDVLFINNNANGPWTVGARIAGWYHPWSDEESTYGHSY